MGKSYGLHTARLPTLCRESARGGGRGGSLSLSRHLLFSLDSDSASLKWQLGKVDRRAHVGRAGRTRPSFILRKAFLPSFRRAPALHRYPHKSYRQCWSCPPKCSSWRKQLQRSRFRGGLTRRRITLLSPHVDDLLRPLGHHRLSSSQIGEYPLALTHAPSSFSSSSATTMTAAIDHSRPPRSPISKRPRPPDGDGEDEEEEA